MQKCIEFAVGSQFGSWTVIDVVDVNRGSKRTGYVCQCKCGTTRTIEPYEARRRTNKECQSCRSSKAKKNSLHYEKLHAVWVSMKQRCYCKDSLAYVMYGGRGIFVCDSWLSDFESFRKWSVDAGYENGLQIYRINNDGPYSPDNCRWGDATTNGANKGNNIVLTAFC